MVFTPSSQPDPRITGVAFEPANIVQLDSLGTGFEAGLGGNILIANTISVVNGDISYASMSQPRAFVPKFSRNLTAYQLYLRPGDVYPEALTLDNPKTTEVEDAVTGGLYIDTNNADATVPPLNIQTLLGFVASTNNGVLSVLNYYAVTDSGIDTADPALQTLLEAVKEITGLIEFETTSTDFTVTSAGVASGLTAGKNYMLAVKSTAGTGTDAVSKYYQVALIGQHLLDETAPSALLPTGVITVSEDDCPSETTIRLRATQTTSTDTFDGGVHFQDLGGLGLVGGVATGNPYINFVSIGSHLKSLTVDGGTATPTTSPTGAVVVTESTDGLFTLNPRADGYYAISGNILDGTTNADGSVTDYTVPQGGGMTTIEMTLAIFDRAGNEGNCVITVNIVRDAAGADLAISCPANPDAVALIGATAEMASVTWMAATATGGDSEATITYAYTNAEGGDVSLDGERTADFRLGETTITATATNDEDTTDTCTFTVTVTAADILPPVITNCPTNIDEEVTFGVARTRAYWNEPTATDDSGVEPIVTSDSTYSSGDRFPIGDTIVTYTATDATGNDADCTFTVTVTEAAEFLVITCPANTAAVALADGETEASVTWMEATATGGSATTTIGYTAADNEGSAVPLTDGVFIADFPVGVTTITARATATNAAGETKTCTFTVTVREAGGDTTPPVISNCPQNAIPASAAVGSEVAFVVWVEPTATDNSGVAPTVTKSHNSGTTFNVGTTPIRYVFTDTAGNEAICEFPVIVAAALDTTAPVITGCPSDITMTIPLNSPGISVTWVAPSATDNSGTVMLASRSRAPGDMFPPGSEDVVYTYVDPAGNTATCMFRVLLLEVDDLPPMATCPNDFTVTAAAGDTSAVVTWTDPTATDNSGMVTLFSQTANSGNMFSVGTTQVTYVFNDPSGNRGVCIFNVTVTAGSAPDTTPPRIFGCPNDVIKNVAAGDTSAVVTWTDPRATDNSLVTPTFTLDFTSGDIFNLGITLVTYVFSDLAGNTATCTFNVTVKEGVDNTAPIVFCPDSVSVTAAVGTTSRVVTWSDPRTADASGGIVTLVSQTHVSGDTFNVGTTRVTYTYMDPTGNRTTCAFDITVTEDTSSAGGDITCPTTTVEGLASGLINFEIGDGSGSNITVDSHIPSTILFTSTGTAAGLIVYFTNAGYAALGPVEGGTFTVTATASDSSGLSGSCTFTINAM